MVGEEGKRDSLKSRELVLPKSVAQLRLLFVILDASKRLDRHVSLSFVKQASVAGLHQLKPLPRSVFTDQNVKRPNIRRRVNRTRKLKCRVPELLEVPEFELTL